ncbi:hypothetical protein [Pseudoalteromonas rubra]|uniref:Uncharacterized protein n=1 Tax=Pseudoalteromonas rubra TaxID=43658 RepID=A0A0F4QB09_9GAMM|nr:hypothetical protein [Pseudoalteromonas rubra]KJZ04540.1 hypothetical protein TW77_23465 [Pseudoalteromonas rubra]
MGKFILITGITLIVFSAIIFVVDLLPVDMFRDPSLGTYLKIVPSDSFSWSQYKIHTLVVGAVLLGLSKFTNLFSS